jgi:endonuclease/exonuclease/phosphatase family metal-dependent hydrolase
MAFSDAPYGELVTTTARVLTWNTWGRFGPWEAREPAIATTIAESGADVVLLQENWFDAEGATQAERLGRALGMSWAHGGSDLLFETWGLGLGLLSRWPIRSHRFEELPALGDGWGGALLIAVVDGPQGPLSVCSVALDWPPQASLARQHAVRGMVERLVEQRQAERSPLVVGGDFNAAPDSDEVRMLTGRRETAAEGFVLFDAWELAGEGPGATWSNANPWAAPALQPSRRIDYVFTAWPGRGGRGHVVAARLAGTEPVDGIIPSDHYGVVADIRY